MASVFDLAKTRTGHKRDQVEDELRGQIDKFEAFLKKMNRELEQFMKKDPPVLTMDEMKHSVQVQTGYQLMATSKYIMHSDRSDIHW